MVEIKVEHIHPQLRELLSFATSKQKVEGIYQTYIQTDGRRLYGFMLEEDVIGCIGIELLGQNRCEIKHLAVMPNHRGKGIGSKMIRYIKDVHALSVIFAVTDIEAVNFYEKCGFKITSLGEKYPGIVRFRCILKV
ncbi:GNAT family N-acetyltransferase [Metabacillus niabensis]|uniref:Ribosomal protein S18 acetylase RimI-like enzyme n=1 Tax=Metabacillus niabensis TaxID=324854 RepID=A0ABT9Z0Y3_9BACI|nr:GNAT family N-acetyltransferase [Metabacillus niabensis]MDQ0225690.1 ribosomal protein S18 acetylase RimI-like enzyme [Metabacillus niabensis]